MSEPKDPSALDKFIDHLKENTYLGSEPGAFFRQGIGELQNAFDLSRDGSISHEVEPGSVWDMTAYEVARSRLDDQGHGVHGPSSPEGSEMQTEQDVLDWIRGGTDASPEVAMEQEQQQAPEQELER